MPVPVGPHYDIDAVSQQDMLSTMNTHSRIQGPGPPALGNVLVIEDEAAVLRLLGMALRHDGFVVWLAGSGKEAVGLYRQHHRDIDLVLLDMQMPGMDGPETLTALREIHQAVRCVFMSGSSGECYVQQLLALGVEGVIAKPFESLDELGRCLRAALSSRGQSGNVGENW